MAFPSRHRPYHLPYEVVQPYNDSYGYPVVNGNGNGEAGLDRLESAAWTGGEVKRGWKGHFTPISPTAPSRGLPDTFSPLSLAIPKPSPSTIRFILLCSLWYTSSALSSNTAKVILNKFPYPITLTIVQFALTSACCLALSNPVFGMTKLRRPTIGILQNTLPMAAFQVGGHILSSMAMNRIPVSTVHTIKALSPLITVGAYALLFKVSYSAQTYFSLLPLTLGVMLACSFDTSASSALGLICAFGSAIVFVSSNIFFKKIMPSNSGSASSHQKLDKINLLFYSSTLAFLLMIPIFATSDLMSILSHISKPRPSPSNPSAPSSHSLFTNFLLNGGVHFLQNIIAFALLATTSPVTYSIASLIKRIAVICIAFVWFSQKVHLVQGFGIALTAVGLWLYNDAKSRGDVEKGEKKARRVENAWEGLLPTSKSEAEDIDVNLVAVPTPMTRPTKLHTHAHPPPLHIPPQTLLQKLPSPTEPYPSPPPSLDSPPPTAGSYFTTGIEVEQKALYNRRATLTSEGGFVGMPISVAS